MEAKAIATGIQQSPRKVGEVAALVRGRSVADALVILEHTPRRAAKAVSKVISSAAANATNNHRAQRDSLVISSLIVGHGQPLKRFRPIARGSANPYKRRASNIQVVVTGAKKPTATKKKTATKKTTEKKAEKK